MLSRVVCSIVCIDPDFTCNDGAIRLVGGASNYSGRVERCQDNQWKAICADQWGENEATVVCRQLGFRTDSEIYNTLHPSSVMCPPYIIHYSNFGAFIIETICLTLRACL